MDWNGKNVLVYGAGRSGIGAAGLLWRLGANTILYDENANLDIEELLGKLVDTPGVSVILGPVQEEILESLDLVVLSPGVPLDIPGVLALKERGLPIIGEVELAFSVEKGRLLAVTGTNGKTTTTSLLGKIMADSGTETFVVGNIGNAYTGEVLKTNASSVTVAEISSFQLETIRKFHPVVSAILNITPDHLNRHHTMEEYVRVKELVAVNQTKYDVCVLNYEDPYLREFGESKCPARVVWFSSKRELPEGLFLRDGEIIVRENGEERSLLRTDELILIGLHNYENVMAAAAVALAAGADFAGVAESCKSFHPVEHRIEFVEEKKGVAWYNDSKGTNPDAAIKGIEAMSRPTLLIAGGYDKRSDYRDWILSFDGRVKYLVLEGETRMDIRNTAISCGFPEERIVLFENMHEACDFCRDHAASGDAVLLSPACASWGEFPNYEVRGERFKAYVREEIE